MLNTLKLIVSLLIVACLFLPLSSCHYQVPDQQQQGEMIDKVEYFYALPNDKSNFGAWRFLPVVVFVLPFFLSLVTVVRRKSSPWIDSFGVLLSMAILAYIGLHYSFNRLEFAGYLGAFAALAYLLMNAASLTLLIRQRWQQRVNHSY